MPWVGDDMRPDESAAESEARNPIIFFDGVCGLCNGFVDFTLARDRRGVFRFAALQGETFAARIRETVSGDEIAVGNEDSGDEERFASIVLSDGIGTHLKSEAVLRVLEILGGKWALARPLRLVPRVFRDWVYDFVAKNRYRWFGKLETCRLPSPEERDRFLP